MTHINRTLYNPESSYYPKLGSYKHLKMYFPDSLSNFLYKKILLDSAWIKAAQPKIVRRDLENYLYPTIRSGQVLVQFVLLPMNDNVHFTRTYLPHEINQIIGLPASTDHSSNHVFMPHEPFTSSSPSSPRLRAAAGERLLKLMRVNHEDCSNDDRRNSSKQRRRCLRAAQILKECAFSCSDTIDVMNRNPQIDAKAPPATLACMHGRWSTWLWKTPQSAKDISYSYRIIFYFCFR